MSHPESSPRKSAKAERKEKPDTSRSSVETIQSIYLSRKEKNSYYSLSAFARDLGMLPPQLSRILNGTRALTLKQGMNIAAALQFTPYETNVFILGIIETAAPNAKISKALRKQILDAAVESEGILQFDGASPLFVDQDIERFKMIAQWYHVAILNLTYLPDFSSAPEWITERLNISSTEARDAVSRLLELGYLAEGKNGRIFKTEGNLHFKTSRSEAAMRTHHSQMIDKAKDEMKKTSADDFADRLINSATFACSSEHIPLLKKKINEFQREVLTMTKNTEHDVVYQLNCQMFPLTKKRSPKKGTSP